MALQSKTLLNDVGSAVLAEAVDQLNRAGGVVNLLPDTLAVGAGPNELGGFIAGEDMFITSISVAVDAAWVAGDTLEFLTGIATDGTGGTVVASVTGLTTGANTAEILAVNVSVDAGTLVGARLTTAVGSTLLGQVPMATVNYRPVKDALNMQPAFTPKMANFRSVAR